MSKMKQAYSPQNSDQESLQDSENLFQADSVIAQPVDLNKKDSVSSKDEFYSESSVSLNNDLSSKNISINNHTNAINKLDKIKPTNSIIKSHRNLPSIIARTIRNNKNN